MFKKITIIPIVALLLSFGSFASTAAANTTMDMTASSSTPARPDKIEIDVMTHLCNANIKNESDFQALSNGKDVLGAFGNQVLNCPATVLPANAPVAGTVAAPQTPFDYTVSGENNSPQMLKDSDFFAEKVCESDINKDVNADGTVSSSTCLDTSEYHFNNLSAGHGKVDVTATTLPQGYHFGTLRFTPPIVDQNNDEQSLLGIDHAQGRIQLDTTNDADKVITLHVYDFVNNDNPQGFVNGMPLPGSGMGSSTMSTSTMGTGTTTTSSLISRIQALSQQIQDLEAQLSALLHQLM